MLPKPLFGDPCNGCGLCCLVSQCPLSTALFGPSGRCPALRPNGLGGYGCGLITDTASYLNVHGAAEADVQAAVAVMVGAGCGCDFATTPEDLDARKTRRDGLISAVESRERTLNGPASIFLNAVRRSIQRP